MPPPRADTANGPTDAPKPGTTFHAIFLVTVQRNPSVFFKKAFFAKKHTWTYMDKYFSPCPVRHEENSRYL